MATFAQQMIVKLKAILLEGAGLTECVIDGVSVKLADIEAKLAYWESRRAVERGCKPRCSPIDLRRT